jgi:hypothetical protein
VGTAIGALSILRQVCHHRTFTIGIPDSHTLARKEGIDTSLKKKYDEANIAFIISSQEVEIAN